MSQNHHARRAQTPVGLKSDLDFDRRSNPVTSNLLLAGYMAHEFLTSGTVLGQKLYPGWTEVGPLFSPPVSQRETNKAHRSYSVVASVFKTDGNHVPGVVNPSQLAKWIQM